MKRFPSLVSPFIATKAFPGAPCRESYSTPVTAGLPLCESTSAPCRSCWKVIAVIINTRCLFSGQVETHTPLPLYLPKVTRRYSRSGRVTRRAGSGDCSRATPLPIASRSSPASCAASIATRTFLPRNDGTSIPPSSTSSTTVPLAGNFCRAPAGSQGHEFRELAGSAASRCDCLRATGGPSFLSAERPARPARNRRGFDCCGGTESPASSSDIGHVQTRSQMVRRTFIEARSGTLRRASNIWRLAGS